jgi:hypothetical protein
VTELSLFNCKTSSLVKKLPCGVPQGSALGGPLFIMYFAPLADSTATSGVTIRQFFYDSQVCRHLFLRPDFSAQVECCSELANWAMRTDAWLTSNRVQLNISKSTFLYASTASRETLIKPAAPLQVGSNLVYPS